MPSNLHDKINSYLIERGIEFSEPYTLPPTRTGTLSQSTDSSWSLLGVAPTYQSNVGPIGGAGSWKITNNVSIANACRVSTTGLASRHNDEDYSAGIWIKFNTLSPGNAGIAIPIHAVTPPSNNIGYAFGLSGSEFTGNPSKFGIQAETAINYASNVTVNTTDWYYLAVRRVDNEVKWYINGNLISTLTVTGTGTAGNVLFGTNITGNIQDYNISNYYVAPASVITETEIAEIWTAGSTLPVPVNYSADPMTASNAVLVEPIISGEAIISKTPATASALMTEPTIIITSNDYTKITTSIIVSAEFLPNFAVYASQNINFIVTEILEASTELINNVVVSTATDDSFSATEFIASAEMLPAKVAESPFIASATMGNHIASVTLSYFKLVKDLNPYLYINNGQSAASIINYGYQSGTFVKGSDLSTNQDGGVPLSLVAEGKSWLGDNSYNSNGSITFETTNYADSFSNLLGTGNFAYEVWVKPNAFPDNNEGTSNVGYGILISDKIRLSLEEATGYVFDLVPRYILLRLYNTSTNQISLTTPLDSTPLTLNNWNHIVINVYQSGINANERLVQLWINGTVVINQNISFTPWTDNTDKINQILGCRSAQLTALSDMYYDECAIYSAPLTNSQIIQHNSFIGTLSPNYTHVASSLNANAESGDHQFVVTSNVTAIATPIIGSALFVDPAVLAVKNISNSATVLTASALNTDVTVYYGWTIYPTPAIAATEMGPAYFLSSYYYQYIQTNFAPYRYVTFDSSAPYLDYGSDTDYSVANVVVNGTVVNPDFGINGKSVKSTGTYINGAAILKESEHDDTWGTGNNSWHSAFWMRRALDDTSTGLRVLWNLNGYADNQNIIVYHYQNKLHIQINGQDDAAITISSANNVNIFDYERHHIVIKSHHNNNQNTLTLFVDGIQIATQNIGSYAITTINGLPHVGPNDEANNFPRLGIGTLITPFGSTALPVVPSNISVYFDEVYWDKNDVTLTEVINQFNAMPDQNNENVLAEPFVANTESVMPAISTQAILSADPATVSAEFVNPTLYIERFIVNTANVMTASALMTEAAAFVPVQINADVMVATATFDNPGIIITIPAQTMYATAILKSQGLKVNNLYTYKMLNPWVSYLRATETYRILPTREVV